MIKVNLHMTHRQYTNGLSVVEVEGKTVGECLKYLTNRFPGIHEALFDKKGQLLRTVEVLVNDSTAYPNELVKPVEDGDELHLLVLLSGG